MYRGQSTKKPCLCFTVVDRKDKREWIVLDWVCGLGGAQNEVYEDAFSQFWSRRSLVACTESLRMGWSIPRCTFGTFGRLVYVLIACPWLVLISHGDQSSVSRDLPSVCTVESACPEFAHKVLWLGLSTFLWKDCEPQLRSFTSEKRCDDPKTISMGWASFREGT